MRAIKLPTLITCELAISYRSSFQAKREPALLRFTKLSAECESKCLNLLLNIPVASGIYQEKVSVSPCVL